MKKSELRQIIKEEVKKILSENTGVIKLRELSPELLARASNKAAELGRNVQANKFGKAGIALKWKKDQEDQQAQYKPVEPFVGKVLNWYFESTKGKGKEEAKIQNIVIEQDGQLVLYLNCDGKFSKEGTRIIFYDKAKDSWFLSDNITPWRREGEYGILGTDMPTAQMLVKIVKAYAPETKMGPNELIKGAQTPILGKHFQI